MDARSVLVPFARAVPNSGLVLRLSRTETSGDLPRMRLPKLFFIAALGVLAACGSSDPVIPATLVRKVTVTGTATTLNVGQSTTLSATGLDANGAVVANAGSTIWTTSSTTVATVDQTGKVTAVGAGTAVITADIADVQGTYTIKVSLSGTASVSPGSPRGLP